MDARKLVAEALGTALLVILAVGTATLTSGFKLAGSSISAGVVATALAFGFVVLTLAYTLGPISGAPGYSRAGTGLGADGWGKASMIGIGAGGAFATEVVLTFVFVLVVLIATSRIGSASFAGLVIGPALTMVQLIGIPLTGTSVNPARSLNPAIVVGHAAIRQAWLFIVAPMIGGALAAAAYLFFVPGEPVTAVTSLAEGEIESTSAAP